MARLHVPNPETNFGCDVCGQTFNKETMDPHEGRELCPECARVARGVEEQVPKATLFRQFKERAVEIAKAAVETAKQELEGAKNAEGKALEEMRLQKSKQSVEAAPAGLGKAIGATLHGLLSGKPAAATEGAATKEA